MLKKEQDFLTALTQNERAQTPEQGLGGAGEGQGQNGMYWQEHSGYNWQYLIHASLVSAFYPSLPLSFHPSQSLLPIVPCPFSQVNALCERCLEGALD